MCDYSQYIEEIKKPVEKQRQSNFNQINKRKLKKSYLKKELK